MKKHTYIHDIKDTLGDTKSQENAEHIAKKIKSAQKKAFPSIEFKQHLRDKLSNIYAIQSSDDVAPRFSLVQLFWAFASFIFIAGGIFSFYQIREITDIEMRESLEVISIPNNWFEMQSDMPDQSEKDIIFTREQESEPEKNEVQMEKSVPAQRNQSGTQNNEIAPKIMESRDIIDVENERIQSDSPMMRSMSFEENNIQSDDNQDIDSGNMMDAWASSSSMSQMKSMENDAIPNMFSDLCEMYFGEYDFDTGVCTLQYGTSCEEYDENIMYDCYIRDNSLSE